jgi:gamma-glutamylaminecyclotransferase
MKEFLVFVYGTLKKGFHNHDIIMDDTTHFLGKAYTAPEYDMVSLGGFPGVLKDGKYRIEGEVYRVNETTLRMLDRLERNGQLYSREKIRLDGWSETPWMYIFLHKPGPNQTSIFTDEQHMIKSWKGRHL